jgi:formiminotetrahydrofolate cyclodeaminase
VARLVDLPFVQLLDAFSSSTPAPGGGAASALSGALGSSLLVMVASLGKSRHGTGEEADALATVSRELTAIRDGLASFIDADTAAYDSVVEAYKLPKATEEEKRQRTLAVQEALRSATDVPLEVMRACVDAAKRALVIARCGYAPAASDVGVALELLQAAAAGAALNVQANLGQLRDGTYVAGVAAATRTLEGELANTLAQARDALR